MDEAKFYVKAGYAQGSRVLVTSRNRSFLEEVFGGRQYSDFCHPVPVLNDKEAAQLVLARDAQGTSLTDLNDHEKKSISGYCADLCGIEGYHPSLLIALGSFLPCRPLSDFFACITEHGSRPIWNSFQKSEEAGVMYTQILLEYNNLSRTAKLIFLDVARCYESKLPSAASWQWNECNSLIDAEIYLSHLHDLSPEDVQTEVKKLQEKNFLKESRSELVLPHFYYLFAWWLLNAGDVNREEKKWFVVCMPEQDDEEWPISMTWPDVSVETVTRVFLDQTFISFYKIDEVMKKLQQFTNLVYLELVRVDSVMKLDLRGLNSLRVMKVKECKNLKEIGCDCASRCHKNDIVDDLIKSRCLKGLCVVQLIDLPSLKVFSFALHCTNLALLLIYDCPKVVEALYQFPRNMLERLVSPRVGISPSNSFKEDLKELVSDARMGQFSKEYLINDAIRILGKSIMPRILCFLRYTMEHNLRVFKGPITEERLARKCS